MKRAISLLVAIVMIVSMIPNVFAASETAVIVEDISEIAVELNADNGYYAEYSWTPSEDGDLSLYQYTEKNIEVMLTQGENTATNYFEDVDGAYYGFATSLTVVADEEVTIEIVNSVEETEEFTIYGEFAGVPGKSEDNPIYLDGTENIVANTGTVYYAGYYGGAQMYITGEGDFTVTLNGETLASENGIVTFPAEGMNTLFAVTGEGEFIIKAEYPVGTQMNPEALFRPAYIVVNIAEGNDQGYFYKWLSQEKGTLTLTCPEVEGVSYDVVLTNLTTYAMSWLSDSTDGTVSIDVAPNQEVLIKVAVDADENWHYAALQTALTGAFAMNDFGTQANPEVIDDLTWYSGFVSQAQGAFDGYYYTWTAAEEGVATFYFGHNEGLEDYELDIVVTNVNTGAQMSLLNDGVDNYGMELQVPVTAGDQLAIMIYAVQDAEGNFAPAADMSWTGNFAAPQGTEGNPIAIDWAWNDAYTDAAATVTVAAGETVYFTGTAGMILTVNGTETDMNADGVFSITNQGAEEATYALALATPVGASSNPEIIEVPFEDTNSLAQDGFYYYIYNVTADGKLVLDVTDGANITADVLTYVEDSEWPISEQFTLAEPEIDENWNYIGWNVAENLTIEVKAGQTVKIQVNGLTDWENWTTPAVDYTLTVEIPAGGEANPIDLTSDLLYENDFSATVKVGAGETVYYQAYRVNGMILSINGVEQGICTTAGMMMPYIWSVTNDGAEEAEYVFTVAMPVGTMDNPEVIEELNWFYGNVSQTEGDTDGYYYTWTAPAEGTATFYFGYNEGLDDYVLDIIVTNQNTYAQKSLLNDGVDNNGMELQIPVSEGDVLTIQVAAIADAEGNYAPAAEMTWCGNFAYPVGSEQNPINIEWTWDDAYANATATVTVEAGKTVYFYGQAGMILTVGGVVAEMDEAGAFAIANSTDAEAAYDLALATPVGAYNNPENIEALPFEDANSLEVNASYNYIWTATTTGTVTLTVSDGANLTVDKLTYSADSEWPISEQFTLAEPEIDENWNYTGWIVADKLVIDVVAGQQLKIQVAGLTDWSNWTTPAIDYTLNAAFEPAYAITKQPENVAVDSGETVQFSVETKGEVVSYQWQYCKLYKWFSTNMEGANTATLTVPAKGSRNGYAYRCAITFADGTVLVSDPAELTVKTYLEVTYHPNDQLVALGDKGQFTAKASGEGLKFMWQYCRPDTDVWAETQMDGYNKETVMIETSERRNGYMYRCKITDVTGNVAYTNVATLTVLTVAEQPQDAFTTPGKEVQFTVAGNVAEGYEYQWEYSSNGGAKWSTTSMTGYNTATLTVNATAKRNGYMYRCVLKGSKDSTITSEPATLHVGNPVEITAQPESVETVAGTTASFTVEATNVYSYKWQYSKNGTDWYGTDMTGSTTDTLTVNATLKRNGYQYRCKIVGTDGTVLYTDAVTLNVK